MHTRTNEDDDDDDDKGIRHLQQSHLEPPSENRKDTQSNKVEFRPTTSSPRCCEHTTHTTHVNCLQEQEQGDKTWSSYLYTSKNKMKIKKK